ncbi:MAG: glycosyltransferase family 4 protein [Luteolibacter sp.]
MNIAIIRSECSFRKGGAERYAANLCGTLAEMGHRVMVLAEKFDPEIHPALIHIPIQVNRSSSWARNRSFNVNSQRELKKLKVDAVFALSRSFPSDAFRVSDPLHRFWMEIRYPGKIHRFLQSLNPRHRAILQLEKAILDPANTRMIVTNSELSKKIIREYYQYPADRIHVVYNGVDHSQFSVSDRERARDEKSHLLFVGQDFKRKGLRPVIEALAAARKAGCDCDLRVIGRDKTKPYEELAQSLGVRNFVNFEGPTKAIQEAYREADLFVFPTFYDPFANVCLEALACGLPVLTTTTNGASELIREGLDGYVIDGKNADAFSNSITEKIKAFCRLTARERSEMRSAARAKAENFTVGRNALAIAGLLSKKS